jgi:hypothetical protein
MTRHELTTQAWFLYKKISNFILNYRHSAKREAALNHLAKRAHARYRRRLKAWWRSKQS